MALTSCAATLATASGKVSHRAQPLSAVSRYSVSFIAVIHKFINS